MPSATTTSKFSPNMTSVIHRTSVCNSIMTTIVHRTSVHVDTVIERLNLEVNKNGSEGLMEKIANAETQDDVRNIVDSIVHPGKDFLYFTDFPHHHLLGCHSGQNKPKMFLYTIGNPLLAQDLMKYGTMAAYFIPPRLLVVEGIEVDLPEGKHKEGTTVVYCQPTSIMQVGTYTLDDEDISNLKHLDKKVEDLVIRITAE